MPTLTTGQMVEVDRAMIEDYHLGLIQMMENDTTTGTIYDPAIRATATMTLALPKQGLLAKDVAEQVGELYLTEISVPPELYAGPVLGLKVDLIFAKSDIVRLR